MESRTTLIVGLAVLLAGCADKTRSSNSTTTWNCFTAGTPVATPEGDRAIEALAVGDRVWSWDEARDVAVARAVTALHRRTVDELVVLTVGGETIETTAEHPFYSLSEGGWVAAADLLPGEVLAEDHSGQLAGIELTGVAVVPGPVEVYNLTVEGPEHDYFAGGVLVHNKTPGGTCCGAGYDDWAPFTVTYVWTDVDRAGPADTNADDLNDENCSSDTLDVEIDDPLLVDDWTFGMAEVGPTGWIGEDCLNGQAGYALCHAITATDQLVEVCTPAEIVPGESTLFDHSKDPFLTYIVDDQGDCFVTGNDPSYYDSLGCERLY